MSVNKITGMKTGIFVCAAVAAAAVLCGCGGLVDQASNAAVDEGKIAALETLLDRIQIEDLLVRYYVDLTSGESHDLAQYYTEDAVLDVNGMISEGRGEIEKLYDSVGDGQPEQEGKMHMLLNNPIISVDGDTATAWVIWTGVANDDLKAAPRFVEQGREYDELVKLDGRWFINKRYITADSGLTAIWEDTYEPREFR